MKGWKFSGQRIMRIEIAVLFVISLGVFLYTAFSFQSHIIAGVIFTVLFLIIYFGIAHIIRHLQPSEEHFNVKDGHLHICHKRKSGTTKDKVPLKHVVHHKLTRRFLGGYVVMKDGKKHQLYFNSEKEVEDFEKELLKHRK